MAPNFPMVRIRFSDAHGQCSDEWESLNQAVTLGEDGVTIQSIGFVINENKKYITLVMNYNEFDNAINGRMTIPKGWITELTYLEPKIEQPSNS